MALCGHFFRKGKSRKGGKPREHEYFFPETDVDIEVADGVLVRALTSFDADYIHQEIFVERQYMQNGLTLADGATVIDVGGNVGFFGAFVALECRRAKIYSYEACPPIFDVLKFNAERLESLVESCTVRNLAVTAERPASGKTLTMHYFPNLPGNSTSDKERKVRMNFHEGTKQAPLFAACLGGHQMLKSITNYGHASQTFEVETTNLSSEIETHGIEQVDLLKVDVEGAEEQVLLGIEDKHWPRIRQVVMEVEGFEDKERPMRIGKLLLEKGFIVSTEINPQITTSCMVWARRR